MIEIYLYSPFWSYLTRVLIILSTTVCVGPNCIKLVYKCMNNYTCVCVCVCVCVCGHVYVVYEDTNLYNDMGMT